MNEDRGLVIAECADEILSKRDDIQASMLTPCAGPIGTHSFLYSDHLQLNEINLNTTIQFDGALPKDWLTFSIRKDIESRLILNASASSTGQRIVTLNNGSEFSGICEAGYSAYNIGVSHASLRTSELFDSLDLRLLQVTSMFEISPLLHQILLEQLAESFLESTCPTYRIEIVRDVALTLLTSLSRISPVPTSNRLRIVRDAIRFVRENLDERIYLEELAAATHCSTRTLQYAFTKTLGMSPKQYLRRYRLNWFRKTMLGRSDGKGTDIAAIAKRFDFKHAGHLSRMYKDLFGNLPSDGCSCGLHDLEHDSQIINLPDL